MIESMNEIPQSIVSKHKQARRQMKQSEEKQEALEGSASPTAASNIANIIKKLTAPDQFHSPNYLADIQRVDAHFRLLSIGVVCVWLFLVALAFWLTPPSNLESLDGMEQNAALFACGILLASCSGKMLPHLYRPERRRFGCSGIIVAAVTIQTVAFLTDGVMALGFRTPVVMDPVLGTRVHLLRWCEWTPLAFFISFLTQGIDLSNPQADLTDAYLFSAAMGVSTFTGYLFPFAPNDFTWGALMTVAIVLYVIIFPRLFYKYKVYRNTKRGVSVEEIEHYDRIRLAFRLLATCTVTWTLLVAMYFLAGIGQTYAPEGSILKNKGFGMVWESIMDVLSKHMYLDIVVDVHKLVFDDGARAERRLAELRRLMSAVWESSSDVICISVRGMSGTVTTMVSPTYARVYRGQHRIGSSSGMALVFDLEPEVFQDSVCAKNVKPRVLQHVDFDTLSDLRSIGLSGTLEDEKLADSEGSSSVNLDATAELESMADLIRKAWKCDANETLLTHDLLKKVDGERSYVPGEASVNRLEENALVVVVRDISERFQRFEAEKKVISETTARKKDEEANRFTRHEVKNGLLAAIGLCDSLKDTVNDKDTYNLIGQEVPGAAFSGEHASDPVTAVAVAPRNTREPSPSINTSRFTTELDKTLKDVLDTVLSEAMARDVIHGVYEPKMERVDINALLSSMHVADVKHDRFPLISEPSPLPLLVCDPQLLKYIHRNAVSNACKYGKKGGIVTTTIRYDSSNEMLYMDVINMPGEYHNELIRQGREARDLVFSQRTRLHDKFFSKQVGHHHGMVHSSGDGAWIMSKCAETLRGQVDISFEQNRTIFSFRSPASRHHEYLTATHTSPMSFQLPPNTWCIAIDDSKIQRRLLERFFMFLGVEEPRRVVLGVDAEEIRGFEDFVVQLIDHNPLDTFFLIVDENLDIEEDLTRYLTMSGSLCIENIRRRLLPNQERRMLALVRSANDSAQDVALYNSRAHGCIPKAPIKKDTIREMVAPLWEKRFLYPPPCRSASISESDGASRGSTDSDDVTEMLTEVRKYLDTIDELCSVEDVLLPQRWPLIWEKLHALKGDLLTCFNNDGSTRAVAEINAMNGPKMPHDFVPRWASLRSLVAETIKDSSVPPDEYDETEKQGSKRHSDATTTEEPSRKKNRKMAAQNKRDPQEASEADGQAMKRQRSR